MMRPVTLVGVALGFLTALAVGQLGLLMSEHDIGDRPASIQVSHTEPLVEAFYAGMNDWIATGDRSLERLISPDFVDHTGSGAADRSGPEFFEQLTSMRTALPSLRFEVLDIETGGSIVSVELRGVTERFSTIDGWSIDLPAQPSFREILRIEEEQVMERWGPDDLWPGGFPPIELTIPAGVKDYRQPSLQQFTLESGSAFDLIVSGTVMLWVESGELHVELSGRDLAGTLKFPTESMPAGAMRLVDPTGTLRVRAVGVERVSLWTVSLDTILVNEPSMGSLAIDIPSGIRQDASVSPSMQLPASGVRLLVHIVILPAGATLSTSAASLHEVAVVGGALRGEPQTGETFYCFDRARSRLLSAPQTAFSGQGFAVMRGGSASYQVMGSEPATLLLLSILPADTAPAQPVRTGPS